MDIGMMRFHRVFPYWCALFFLSLLLVGCATPTAVRTLSEEQLITQEAYIKSQQQYFQVIEKYVDVQVSATEAIIHATTRELNEKYKRKALTALSSANKGNPKVAIDDLTTKVLSEQQADQASLLEIKASVAKLKELHRQMLKALTTILAAQRKLNEYIQLEKSDEKAVSQLLSIVGIERAKVDDAVAKAADIFATFDQKPVKGN